MKMQIRNRYLVGLCKLNSIHVFSLLTSFLCGTLFTYIYIQKSSILISTQKYLIPYESLLINNVKTNLPSITSSDTCGTWQQSYINLHRSILNGSLPPRYLISVAVEAGLADRLTGTLTEFFFALLTNRAFQIVTYGTLPRFEAAFLTPNINWSRSIVNDELISNLKFTYRGQRGYSGDRSYPSHINTSLYWPMYLVNDDQGNEFFRSSNVSKYPLNHEDVQTLFVSSNRGRIIRLFDNPYHRFQLFQMGLHPATVIRCAFDFLFSPTESLKKAMSREFSILSSSDILKISINIRVGDAVFDPNADSQTNLSSYDPYFNCASTIESYARLPNQIVIWYFTSDSLKLRQLVKEKYGEKILTEDKLRYVHGDCGDSPAKRYGNCTNESQDFSIRMSAGQIYAMSMCDYHVVSAQSGFGRFAASLSNHWHSVYQIHDNINRSCTIDDHDTLEYFTTNGAGI